MSLRDDVLAVVRRIPAGETRSFGEVATEAGHPGAARATGSVMASSAGTGVPWWRVVYADGRLCPGLEAEAARRLVAEGVVVVDDRVVAEGT